MYLYLYIHIYMYNPTKGTVLLKEEGKDDSSVQEFETRGFLRSQVYIHVYIYIYIYIYINV
jgi:hypothetical protein